MLKLEKTSRLGSSYRENNNNNIVHTSANTSTNNTTHLPNSIGSITNYSLMLVGVENSYTKDSKKSENNNDSDPSSPTHLMMDLSYKASNVLFSNGINTSNNYYSDKMISNDKPGRPAKGLFSIRDLVKCDNDHQGKF